MKFIINHVSEHCFENDVGRIACIKRILETFTLEKTFYMLVCVKRAVFEPYVNAHSKLLIF